MDNLFSTHPNPANRIEALQRQAAEMGIGGGARGPGFRQEMAPEMAEAPRRWGVPNTRTSRGRAGPVVVSWRS